MKTKPSKSVAGEGYFESGDREFVNVRKTG